MTTVKKNLSYILAILMVLQTSVYASDTSWGQAGQEEPPEKKKCDKDPPECCEGKAGEPVYLYSGEFYYTHVDLELPGIIPIQIKRHYSSFSLYNAEFGYGWIMNYDYKLYRQHDGNLLLRRGCYDRDVFTGAGNNTFNGPADTFETITENQDGTYTLNRKDNQKYQFNINGCLSSMDDTNGNQLVFSYSDTKLPVNGISPFSNIVASIVIGYSYRLLKIEQVINGQQTGRFVQFSYDGNGRIVSVRDSFAREVFYVYDGSGNGDLVSFIDAEGNPYNYTYASHLMTEFVGMGCNDCSVHTNYYDAQNRVIRQTHGSSALEFNYITPFIKTKVTRKVYNDATGQLLRQYDKTYDFDQNRNVVQETTQNGNETIILQNTYNAQSQITQKTDPLGSVTTYTYDNNGNITQERVQAIGGGVLTKAYAYNNSGKKTSEEVTSSWDGNTYRTEYVYDNRNNLVEERKILDGNTAYVTSYTYTQEGLIDTVTYPSGSRIKYEYNNTGLQTKEYDPDNPSHKTEYTYDNWGNRASITDENDHTTTFTYDSLNRLISATNSLGIQTLYTWTNANLTGIEEGKTAVGAGRATRMVYDELNRKTDIIKETGSGDVTIAQYTYDSEGNVLSVTDANGNTTNNSYDTMGRLAGMIDPLGNTTAYAYDKLNNVISVTDAESNTTAYQYNGLGRLTKAIQPGNIETNYTYNALGNILTIADAENNTTTNTYDRLGRLTGITDPLNHTTAYSYDGNDNLIQKTDANGAVINYTYDNYNRLSTIHYPLSAVSFTYDNAGNLLTSSDGAASALYTYDALNRISSSRVTYPFGNKTISYTYDRFGSKKTVTYPDTDALTYDYDDLNRLTAIRSTLSAIVNYAYDNVGRITTKTLGNDTVTSYNYDPANRLTAIINPNISYTHDYVGNRLSKTDTRGEHTYDYDNLYRLIGATLPEETYTYDKVGNRLTNQDHNDWQYNTNNQLTHYNSTDLTYDNNGNTLTKITPDGTATYTWDPENRLTSVNLSAGASVVNYSYDPFGKRLNKTVNGVVTWYLYDNEDIIAEYDNTGTLLRSYIHGPGIDEPIRMTDASTSSNYFYLSDGLGSIIQIQDSSKNTVESYIYNSFGTPIIKDSTGTTISQSAIGNPYMFTAREWDGETGLYFYRARYYDAGVGRFLSKDNLLLSILLLSETPNSYLYVKNNPINYIDPTGYTGIAPPITPNYQAQIDALRAQIRALEEKLNDPCLSAAAKGSIRKWIKYLRILIEFLLRLWNQEPPDPPPDDPRRKQEIVIKGDPNKNKPKIYGPY